MEDDKGENKTQKMDNKKTFLPWLCYIIIFVFSSFHFNTLQKVSHFWGDPDDGDGCKSSRYRYLCC